MSKVEKYSNSIKIVKSSEENSQKPKIITTKTIEVVSRRGNSRDKENKNTGQFQYKKETNIITNHQLSINNNRQSNNDSYLQRSTLNQTVCTCGKNRCDTMSAYNATIQTNISGTDKCTCDKMNLCTCYNRKTNKTMNNQNMNINERNIFIQDNGEKCSCNERQVFSNATSDYNEYIPNVLTDEENSICTCGKKTIGQRFDNVNLATSSNDMPIESTSYDEKKINIEKKVEKIEKKIETEWSGNLYIQAIERMQYLAADSPALRVQFLNDMLINPTIRPRGPIQVLIPIPDNFIQKQDTLEILSKNEKKVNEDICAENVDLLNISHAYSIPTTSFNNLQVENEEIYIASKEEKPIEFTIENHGLDIDCSIRTWTGIIKPIRICKLDIKVPSNDWNDMVQIELANEFDFSAEKDNSEEEIKEKIDDEGKIEMFFEKEEKIKTFKTIDLGNNEFITLKAQKRVLQKTEESNIKMGGKGFYLWDPVPFLAQSMTLERSYEYVEKPKPEKKDWNLTNSIDTLSSVNILTKEKIISIENIKPIEVPAEINKSTKWNTVIKRQNNFKLGYVPKKKKWILKITKKVNDLFFEREPDEVIVNDDYNDIKGPQRRPVQATIIKISDEDESSSVSSYDVFQHLIMKRNINFNLNSNLIYQNNNEYEYQIKKNKTSGYKYAYIPMERRTFQDSYRFGNYMDEKQRISKIRISENEQKNQYDKYETKVVKHSTTKIKDNSNELFMNKKKKIEIIRDEPEVKNYLRI